MPRTKSASAIKEKPTDNAKKALGGSLTDGLLLRDAVVVSASFERKLLPELAPRGKIETDYSLEIHPGQRRKKRGLIALLSLKMNGQDANPESKTSGQEAFSANINLEGFFELIDQDHPLDSEDVCPKTIQLMLLQLMPIASLKARDFTAAMGFGNVRQSIGFNVKEFDTYEVETVTLPQPQKRQRTSGRAKKLVATE